MEVVGEPQKIEDAQESNVEPTTKSVDDKEEAHEHDGQEEKPATSELSDEEKKKEEEKEQDKDKLIT